MTDEFEFLNKKNKVRLVGTVAYFPQEFSLDDKFFWFKLRLKNKSDVIDVLCPWRLSAEYEGYFNAKEKVLVYGRLTSRQTSELTLSGKPKRKVYMIAEKILPYIGQVRSTNTCLAIGKIHTAPRTVQMLDGTVQKHLVLKIDHPINASDKACYDLLPVHIDGAAAEKEYNFGDEIALRHTVYNQGHNSQTFVVPHGILPANKAVKIPEFLELEP